MLDAHDRHTLLALARASVHAAVEGHPPPGPGTLTPALEERRAAFVTLHLDGDLRGCIGHTRPVEPLWKSVREMAAAAATLDSRFDPLQPDDVAAVSIEISALTPMWRVRPDEVVVGTHGLFIRLGGRTGLLLPQVATEHGWDRPTFLKHTCLKADLPGDAYLDPRAELFAFEADRFGEPRPGAPDGGGSRSDSGPRTGD